MDRQGMTQPLPGGGAPRAGQPGMGVGNVPYAKGMISGNFGQKNAGNPPAPGGFPIEPPSDPAAPPPGGGGQSPAPPPGAGAAAGMMAGQTPFLQPQFLFEVYAAIMSSFLQAAEGDGMPWGYTY